MISVSCTPAMLLCYRISNRSVNPTEAVYRMLKGDAPGEGIFYIIPSLEKLEAF